MNNYNLIKFGEFEDCYSAYVPKKSKSHTESQLERVFTMTCERIDVIQEGVMIQKFRKLSNQLLQYVYDEIVNLSYLSYDMRNMDNQSNININFVFLSIDQANQNQVEQFYKKLLKDKSSHQQLKQESLEMVFQDGKRVQSIMMHVFTALEDDQLQQLAQILNFIIPHLRHQYKAKADAHTTVFLIEGLYNLPGEFLSELKKTLQEEFLSRNIFSNILIILPASEMMLLNYEANGLLNKSYSFSDPKHMLIELLLQLIKKTDVPLLCFEIYQQLYQDFQTYITSYQSQVNKIKAAYLMYFSKQPSNGMVLTCLIQSYNDQKTTNPIHMDYLRQRNLLNVAIQDFQNLIKSLKKQLNWKMRDMKLKMFNLLCSSSPQQNAFQIPTSGDSGDIQKAVDLFIEMSNDDFIKKFLNEALVYINIGVQQKKETDRILKLLQKPDTKRERFEKAVNNYLNQLVLGTIEQLKRKYSQYIFTHVDVFNQLIQPDILEQYHEVLSNAKHPHIQQTQILYTKLARLGQLVQANELFEKDKDTQGFFNSIGELKLLGLIEDTKKTKLTYQKSFYAKQMFTNYLGD